MASFEFLPTTITVVFLLVVVSYYVLLFVKLKKPKFHKHFSSISVIIPAHNEERYIRECIRSVINADFDGTKEIIVVDDGSKDHTADIASEFKEVLLIRKKHTGKSDSLNQAIAVSKGELIAIVDGDSFVHKDALVETSKEVERKKVAAAACIVRVKNRKHFICIWLDLEQLYNSLIRRIFSKLNANIVTPGPLSVYRKKELLEVGGFSTKGFSEDIDVTIRLIRKGYKIGFSSKAIAETNMPYDAKGFLRQRTRLARGIIDIFKKHLRLNKAIIDIYTLPLFLFNYAQAVIMGSFTVYQIATGYFQYFVAKGIYFNWLVLKFFFEWLSVVGFVKWTISIMLGQTPLTLVSAAGILSTLLTYPLYIYAILKYSRKFDLLHLIALFFMSPYWLLIMFIYIISLPEYFRKDQHNIWKKNE
ncbi:MAG: glycosyltransferase [Nanoarchaeota archaeon]|nr:glycosyltransferase [Nanoarchaeota archaeon]MBU1704792.1 glycosyltransferase [Nanoarchaeota archaeon]